MIQEELTGELSGDSTQLRVWDDNVNANVDMMGLLSAPTGITSIQAGTGIMVSLEAGQATITNTQPGSEGATGPRGLLGNKK